jgi:hypothetical protein
VPEIKLFRMLYSHLKPGDVALLSQRGIDCVFRMHHLRKSDFSKGKKLGLYDHIVT